MKQRIRKFGVLDHVHNVTHEFVEKGYELELFTEVFWIKFHRLHDARKCKIYLDAKEFYGGILHISYAPEYESIDELREKLNRRKTEVEYRLKVNAREEKIMKFDKGDNP